MQNDLKTCSKCKWTFPLSEFGNDKQKKTGKRPDCKVCVSEQHKAHYQTHKDEIRLYQDKYDAEHAEHLKIKAKELWDATKHIKMPKRRAYFDARKPEKSAYDAEYRTRPETNQRRRDTHSIRMKTDVQYALQHVLRGRLSAAIKSECKTGSAVRDLGCSIEFFKKYLEERFEPGMTWENRGRGDSGWHIDHIIPMDAYNLEDRQHLILACHYTNLRPLWGKDNLTKSNKYPDLPVHFPNHEPIFKPVVDQGTQAETIT